MYIERDSTGRYSLQDMTGDDVRSLADMIRGASIIERRAFFDGLIVNYIICGYMKEYDYNKAVG